MPASVRWSKAMWIGSSPAWRTIVSGRLRVSRAPMAARSLRRSLRGRPVVALLSGPAAGVSGAAEVAHDAGWEAADLMTLDVGGTSADIGIVRDGRPVLSSEEHIAEFPVLIPTVAVSSIGAGGGSIIWLDPTGSLKVGPRSVGADPGPACYGTKGSLIPALTDAFLVAGLLNPDSALAANCRCCCPRRARRLARSRRGSPARWRRSPTGRSASP